MFWYAESISSDVTFTLHYSSRSNSEAEGQVKTRQKRSSRAADTLKLAQYPEVRYVSIYLVFKKFETVSDRSVRRACGCLHITERVKQPRWNGERFHTHYFTFQRYEIAKSYSVKFIS